jgi:dTDP-4-amino-4,6-dideoxygalactose transaminase
VSADLFRRHLAIPMHANLTDDEVERVATTVRDAVQASR